MAALKIDLTKTSDRHYDPETGRFVSKDPIGFNGGSTNLYQYTILDPVNYIDGSGLRWQAIGGAPGESSGSITVGVTVGEGIGLTGVFKSV